MSDGQYPELLRDLREALTEELARNGVENTQAAHYAHACVERIRSDWGGQMLYIAKGLGFYLSARDLEIFAKYNGRNRHQLCREYNITEQWLYKIIKAARKRELAKRQMDMFGAPEPGARRDA